MVWNIHTPVTTSPLLPWQKKKETLLFSIHLLITLTASLLACLTVHIICQIPVWVESDNCRCLRVWNSMTRQD